MASLLLVLSALTKGMEVAAAAEVVVGIGMVVGVVVVVVELVPVVDLPLLEEVVVVVVEEEKRKVVVPVLEELVVAEEEEMVVVAVVAVVTVSLVHPVFDLVLVDSLALVGSAVQLLVPSQVVVAECHHLVHSSVVQRP